MESQEPTLLSDGYPRFISESDIYDPVKYEPEATEVGPRIRYPAITKEFLIDDVPTTAVLRAVASGIFSVRGYEFAVTRRGDYYDGQFFPSTQSDSVPLADIRSQLNVYNRSGQKITEMHFKALELPTGGIYAKDPAELEGLISAGALEELISAGEVYETEDVALDILMSTLAPILWRIEHDSVDQLELFKLADIAITASRN